MALYVVLAIYAFAIGYTVATQPKQWDFKTYYYAAEAWTNSQNPYDLNTIDQLSDEKIELEFVYPPITLPVFALFTLIPFKIAFFLFFALKVAGLIFLLWLWVRYFVDDKAFLPLLFLLAAFAFRETIARDMYAGNISIFEQVLLWTAMLSYLRGKIWTYCLLIAAAALFKFTFLILLFLPMIERDRRILGTIAITAAGYIVANLVSFWLMPGMLENFITNVGHLSDGFPGNQSSLIFISEMLETFTRISGYDLYNFASVIHILFVMVLMLYTIRVTTEFDFKENRLHFVVMCLFLYAMSIPRLKDYSFILLIFPAFFVISKALVRPSWRLIAIFFVCVSFLPFQPFLAALALYLIYLQSLRPAQIAL